MNIQKFKDAVAYLGSKLNKLSQEAKTKLMNGDLPMRANEMYIRKQISVGGKISLITSSTEEEAGLSSFDGNKLGTFVYHIIDRIKFGYEANAAEGKEAELSYKTALPAALRNAQLNIKQNDQVVFSLPIATVHNANTGATILDDFKQLDNFELLVPNESINLELEFAPNAAIAGTDKHYVELILGGFTTFTR